MTETYAIAAITSLSKTEDVFLAIALTATVVVGLTMYAFYTQDDFTMCGGTLFLIGCVLLVATIMSFFIRNKIVDIIIASIALIFWGIYLIYDTQLIVGGKSRQL